MHLRKGLLPGISYRLLLCFSIGFIACVGSESTTATTPSSTLPAELPPEIVSSSTKPPLQEWKEYDVPSPRKDIYSCGRNKKSWICDPDGILTEDEADLLDAQMEHLRETTGSCHCSQDFHCPNEGSGYGGWQGAVAILRKIHVPYHEPTRSEIRTTADRFSDYLRDYSWEIGVCDDDFVILISVEDRVVFTATGAEISNTLTNECVDAVYKENKEYLSTGLWADGIQNMIFEYNRVLLGNHACVEKKSKTGVIVGAVIGSLLGVLVLFVVCMACKGKGGGGGSSGRSFFRAPSFDWGDGGGGGGGSSGGGGGSF